jgi:hypothetical protein
LAVSTGGCFIFYEAGYFQRKLPPSSFFSALPVAAKSHARNSCKRYEVRFQRIRRKKMHSKVQIIAPVNSSGSGLLQFSHVGRSSGIFSPGYRDARR